jgi:hypothetical protein
MIRLSRNQVEALKRLHQATGATNYRRWASTTGLRVPAATLDALTRMGLVQRRPPTNQHSNFPHCFRRRVHHWTITPLGRAAVAKLAQRERRQGPTE